jgi:hypothetical protein
MHQYARERRRRDIDLVFLGAGLVDSGCLPLERCGRIIRTWSIIQHFGCITTSAGSYAETIPHK